MLFLGTTMSMPRPNVPDRLIEEVESLHENRQSYEAGSFQEALATVIEMATPKLVEEVGLLVGKSYPDDSGRNIVRLHRDTFQQLDVPPGRPVEITGKQTTIATAEEMKKADPNPATIRMDGFVRENVGVDVDESARVQRASGIPDADTVTFERTASNAVTFDLPDTGLEDLGTDATEVIHRQVRNRYLSRRDIVPIMPDDESANRAVVLTVTETNPEAHVYINDSTEIALTESE